MKSASADPCKAFHLDMQHRKETSAVSLLLFGRPPMENENETAVISPGRLAIQDNVVDMRKLKSVSVSAQRSSQAGVVFCIETTHVNMLGGSVPRCRSTKPRRICGAHNQLQPFLNRKGCAQPFPEKRLYSLLGFAMHEDKPLDSRWPMARATRKQGFASEP